MKKLIYSILLGMGTVALAGQPAPNVLFIAIDDLNDWVGCLGGHPQTLTPNMDRLAEEGMLFTNAHCQAPICGPSRASILTGLAPWTSGIYLQIRDQHIKASSDLAAQSTFLPDWFEAQGYKTIGAGKVFHNGDRTKSFQEFFGRSDFGPKPKERMVWDPKKEGVPGSTQTDWGPYPETDQEMPDFKTAEFVVGQLKETHEQPFFLAAGFCRPHVPLHVPQKWFDLHPLESIQLPPYLPNDMDDVPEMAQTVAHMPMMPTTEWMLANNEWEKLVQAYLACVTFVDAQVGKVLDALRESAYAENTIVVLWSDHGYHLGEKNRVCKQAIWERTTRTVFMIKTPDMRGGKTCGAPVQLLDMYPTLLELCSLPENSLNDGHSLVPLLENPDCDWSHLALTSYGRENLSMRNRTHRYIRYEGGAEELYDLVNDPNEWTNLAARAESGPIKAAFNAAAPEEMAELSNQVYFSGKPYWTEKIDAAKKRDR